MNKTFLKKGFSLLAVAGLVWPAAAVSVARRQLPGHVPAAVANLSVSSHLAATNQINLAIGLPLRNTTALTNLMGEIYDSASPKYRQYLTPEEFTAQFGPTEQEYQAVKDFAAANSFTVTATHANRMLVEVRGSAADVERAFNVQLNKYPHPTESREFFAPATAPSVPASLAVLDVTGLSDFPRPTPRIKLGGYTSASPKTGSGPGGLLMGYDYRNAYVPGTTLTGVGQKVAFVQFDGYFASDIALYAQQSGLPAPVLTNILINGFSGIPTLTGGEGEVTLDLEMTMSMAPNLDMMLVYEGDPFNFSPNAVLNRIAADNAARQVSCSWGWTGGPTATTEQIFLQMILQGQAFLNASGDWDSSYPGWMEDPNFVGYPSGSANIVQVGGTTLTTGAGAAYVSETVWTSTDPYFYRGVQIGELGSSGGISSVVPLPIWQQGIANSSNNASATFRNVPDVSMPADGINIVLYGANQNTGGTSASAPLWAGYLALVNQQAVAQGKPTVGFPNPSLYSIAKTASYNSCFYDITNGNNAWVSYPTNYFAVGGYDLCTGLGSPKGVTLINALVNGTNTALIISAPLPLWGTNLAALNGSNPNGAWLLFVQDDALFDSGSIAKGWQLNLTTANPVGAAADLELTMTSPATNILGNGNLTYVIAVTNYGPSACASNAVITITLPAAATFLSAIPTKGFVSTLAGISLTWNAGPLAVSAAAKLTLTLRATGIGSYANTAHVDSTTTTDPNPDDDTATVTINAITTPQLSGFLIPGGDGRFRLSMTNEISGSVIIQASTNLFNWVNISTNTLPFIYTNGYTTNYSARFYRAVLP